jgi:hypothetical protein
VRLAPTALAALSVIAVAGGCGSDTSVALLPDSAPSHDLVDAGVSLDSIVEIDPYMYYMGEPDEDAYADQFRELEDTVASGDTHATCVYLDRLAQGFREDHEETDRFYEAAIRMARAILDSGSMADLSVHCPSSYQDVVGAANFAISD